MMFLNLEETFSVRLWIRIESISSQTIPVSFPPWDEVDQVNERHRLRGGHTV